ncbi:FkbM family methyltransferase [Gammaproteobacteria bacterium]|nr:FkbM family methyltransferase [Gammaproteobacteria bacterium]
MKLIRSVLGSPSFKSLVGLTQLLSWDGIIKYLRTHYLCDKKSRAIDIVEYENQIFVRELGQIQEPWLQVAISKRMVDANVFVDVGSGDGMYVVLAQKHLGSAAIIIGIDPRNRARSKFAELRQDDARWAGRMRFGQVALSDRCGTDFIRKDSLCKNIAAKNRHKARLVKTTTLDRLMFDDLGVCPDLIKIDVEGWEYTLLKGCKRIIAQCQSEFFIEIHWNYLVTSGYSGWDVLNLFDEQSYNKELLYFGNGEPFPKTDRQGHGRYRKTALSYYHISPKRR